MLQHLHPACGIAVNMSAVKRALAMQVTDYTSACVAIDNAITHIQPAVGLYQKPKLTGGIGRVVVCDFIVAGELGLTGVKKLNPGNPVIADNVRAGSIDH